MALCYLWIDFYQSIIIHSEIWKALARPAAWNHSEATNQVVSWLLMPWMKWIPTKICIYAAIQLSCSTLAFVDIGLGLLGNEPWQYPPIFGSSIGVMQLSFQAIWGEWWHDLFRFTFLGIADWVIRSSKAERWEHILVLGIPFSCYAAIHASLSYAVSHDAHASAWVIIFGGIQPLVILVQAKLRLSMHSKKKLLHDLIGLAVLLNTFGLLLGNPGVLHSLASFPIPISVWRKGAFGMDETNFQN
ncbi:hypothetical protein N7466_009242 [Penicillium verhagenii]|uniref:uncharacterized protein n=1 Tax=Penicillium verhagenii TaxID=1562060 RepID=UPI0025450866|nr:uncharacterized protein N7466_009242 [Penicillium verhagenii]KAJ5920916.1 hypothetical protein N7466_009242 [Penicillium verhagenii]